jgi:site-specific recombinase XerD
MAERTIYGYLRAVRQLAQFSKRSPDKLDEEHVRQWLLHLKVEKQLAYGSLRVAFSGLKFFFTRTCRRQWKVLAETKLQNVKALPDVLTVTQVQQVINASTSLRMKTFFWTVYSLGLRLEEGLNLHVGDIDNQRMMVHVHRGKGAKDRYLPLPNSTLMALREYWKTHRNPLLLFPADRRNHKGASTTTTSMSPTSVQSAIKKIVKQLRFGKQVSTHTLRHSYASHLLEAGVSLKAVQKYLGHSSLQTTLMYLHLTETAEADARKVIDELFVRPTEPNGEPAK